MKSKLMTAALAAAALACGAATAAAQGNLKRFVQEDLVNEDAKIMVRVEVDHADRVYHEGEPLTVKVVAEKDCYVHLIDIDPAGEATCLFPNAKQPDNFIKGGVEVSIPAEGDTFRIRTRAPFGEEVLCVVATLGREDLFPGKNLRNARVTPLTGAEVRGMKGTLDKKFDVEPTQSGGWAEHRVSVRTVAGPRGNGPTQVNPGPKDRKAGRRFGVCIGISDYKDPRIPDLKLSHEDASRMKACLLGQCGVEDVTLLVNEQATREAIRRAIFEEMASKSRPGDTVFLYFSGHGGRCADTNGDEKDGDGVDEYIVPYDGVLAKPEETMIIDDEFGRWLNELQGRQILVILDNCYSGGAAKTLPGLPKSKAAAAKPPRAKGLSDPSTAPTAGLVIGGGAGVAARFDFFEKEVSRVNHLRFRKDIDGAGTVVLAASRPDQIAFEMPSGEGSVLTYYFLKVLGERPGRLAAPAVYDGIKASVEDYVKKTFQTDQNPVLIGEAPDLLIRP